MIISIVSHICRLKNVFAELCSAFYKEEGRRIKARIEKRNFASVELSIRYCFKVRTSISKNLVLLIIQGASLEVLETKRTFHLHLLDNLIIDFSTLF